MDMHRLRRYLLPSLALAFTGLAIAFLLVTRVPPYPWARWLFFSALFSAAFGAAFPFFFFWQTVRNRPLAARIASRQAALTGFYLVAYLWLEQAVAISRGLALLLALALIGLDALLGRRRPASLPEEMPDEPA